MSSPITFSSSGRLYSDNFNYDDKASLRELRKQKTKEQDYKCLFCRCKFSKSNPPTLEHIVPLLSGGSNDEFNLVVACQNCNNLKGSASFLDFFKHTLPKQRNPPAEKNEFLIWDKDRNKRFRQKQSAIVSGLSTDIYISH